MTGRASPSQNPAYAPDWGLLVVMPLEQDLANVETTLKATEWLAVYAATLSTIVFAWNVFQSRPRLKVMIVFGIEGVVVGAHISVQNRSSQTIHLSNIAILYRHRKPTWKEWLSHAWKFKRFPRRLGWVHSSLSNYEIPDGCPVALEARNSHHVLVPEETLESIFQRIAERKIMAVVQDKIWNNVYSNVFEYSVPRVSVAGA